VGKACGTHGRGEKSVQSFGGKTEEKRPLGRPRRRWGTMGSEWILARLAGGSVGFIRLAQDIDRWRAVVSAMMNLRVLAPRS
jgi:hypothetical protein